MSDIVWVGLISTSGALIAALVTQLLAARAASTQAGRAEQKEAMQWRRSEATRKRDRHRADLREFWALTLQAQARIVDFLSDRTKRSTAGPLAQSATGAAAQAYAVALIGIAGVRPSAKEFYLTTAQVEFALESQQPDAAKHVTAWRSAFEQLEAAVTREADADTGA